MDGQAWAHPAPAAWIPAPPLVPVLSLVLAFSLSHLCSYIYKFLQQWEPPEFGSGGCEVGIYRGQLTPNPSQLSSRETNTHIPTG